MSDIIDEISSLMTPVRDGCSLEALMRNPPTSARPPGELLEELGGWLDVTQHKIVGDKEDKILDRLSLEQLGDVKLLIGWMVLDGAGDHVTYTMDSPIKQSIQVLFSLMNHIELHGLIIPHHLAFLTASLTAFVSPPVPRHSDWLEGREWGEIASKQIIG